MAHETKRDRPAIARLIWSPPETQNQDPASSRPEPGRRGPSRKAWIWSAAAVVLVAGGGGAVLLTASPAPVAAAAGSPAGRSGSGATAAAPARVKYLTYSSATDGLAVYRQNGTQFEIEGAGADLWTDADSYTTIYRAGAVTAGSTIETEVTGESGMTAYAKAGIIVRNAMTTAGTGVEGVVLYVSPEGGIQLEWDADGGPSIDDVAPANGAIPESLPAYLKLVVAAGGVYTGYYSVKGTTWTEVGSATVPDQKPARDAGLFVMSHASGIDGLVDFSSFTVTTAGKAG
jgi:hypothetical protein